MGIEKPVLFRVVSIALDADNKVTHAHEDVTYAFVEDGIEKSRHTEQKNIEPADLGKVFPRVEMVAQVAALKLAASKAEEAAALKLAEVQSAADERIAELSSKLAEAEGKLATADARLKTISAAIA